MMKFLLVFISFCGVIFFYSCTKDQGTIPAPQPAAVIKTKCDSLNVTYSGTIQPIINTKCAIAGCHVSGSFGNGIDLTSYALVKARVDAIDQYAVKTNVMPQTGGPLSADAKEKIQCWIDAGAPDN